jgi:Protein of unknown function (DUF3592)
MNGSRAVTYTPRARKARRYTALALLFLVPLGVIGLGAWLLAAGIGIRSQVEPVAGWLQTTGRVTSFHTYQPTYEGQLVYRPVIAFRAADRIITFSAPGVGQPPVIGSPVRVAYDPRDPADAHDLSLGSSWEGQFYLGIGLMVLGVAVLALFYWLIFLRPKSGSRAGGAGTPYSEGRHVRSS